MVGRIFKSAGHFGIFFQWFSPLQIFLSMKVRENAFKERNAPKSKWKLLFRNRGSASVPGGTHVHKKCGSYLIKHYTTVF
jgi:hypothetical protein